MAKQSQIDRAIENLKVEISVLEMAVARLEAQKFALKTRPKRKPKGPAESE